MYYIDTHTYSFWLRPTPIDRRFLNTAQMLGDVDYCFLSRMIVFLYLFFSHSYYQIQSFLIHCGLSLLACHHILS